MVDLAVEQSEFNPDTEASSRRKFYEVAWTLKQGLVESAALRSLKKAPEGITFEENPNYRPISDIIKEAVEGYLSADIGHSIKLPPKERVGHSDFLEYLKQGGFSRVSLRNRIDIVHGFSAFLSNSGRVDAAVEFGDAYGFVIKHKEEDLKEVEKSFWEFAEKEECPVSCSVILNFFLNRTEGDIRNSLYETLRLLKYLARGESLRYQYLEEDPDSVIRVETFRDRILDEFSLYTNYHKLDSKEPLTKGGRVRYDFSLVNQIGKPYHAFNLAALSMDFTPEFISDMLFGEYVLQHPGKHGPNKALSDAAVMKDLYNVGDVVYSNT